MFRHLYVLAPEGAPTATATPAASSSSSTAPGNSSATPPVQGNGAKPANDAASSRGNAPLSPEKGAKPSAEPELIEIKSGGKTKKVTREQLIKLAEHADGADLRFQEAAAMKKRAEGILERVRNPKDAIALLQDPSLGLSKDQIREAFEDWYTTEFIEPSKLTPEQKKLSDAEKELKKYKEKEEREAAEKQRREDEEMDAKTVGEIQKEIIATIETSGLPRTRFVVSRIAHWTRINETKGINAPRETIVNQVRSELRRFMDDMVQNTDGEALVNLLGEGTAKKLRTFDLQRLKDKRAKLGSAPAPAAKPREERREKIRSSEVNRRLRDLRIGKLR